MTGFYQSTSQKLTTIFPLTKEVVAGVSKITHNRHQTDQQEDSNGMIQLWVSLRLRQIEVLRLLCRSPTKIGHAMTQVKSQGKVKQTTDFYFPESLNTFYLTKHFSDFEKKTTICSARKNIHEKVF